MRRLLYRVEYAFDPETGSVTATVPELNHVSSFGTDFAEAERNVTEAALLYLETLAAHGEPPPEPATQQGTLLTIDLAA
ncbi:MAG TPA: type II toxin-antitoxin system HicB family antitoxin [Deinococcales bacterium]|nr:type II toxin-antitoxin system HicB family antitoxin [Deinococcales bacterium]